MLTAKIILLCIQCINLFLLIALGIIMAVSNKRYKKRQEEYKKRELEILKKYGENNNDKE